ncbi:MAG: alpha/beta hydrolase [Pseudomonadota bacterium]|nr:alpha/beta hydrolase [Pseudomonadota bacterium]MDE3037179.1 alpha/beta hydrolase [Pseudomonadota bacterium]
MLSVPTLLSFNVPNAAQPRLTHRLACWQWGNPDAAQTILCVHGLTRNGRDFDTLAEALSKDYRVLCPDMPGRGKSEWLVDPTGYNNAAYVAGILFMLGQLGITQIHWIGTSMGGILGLLAANTAPGLIRALVLNDVGCLIPAAALTRILSYAKVSNSFSTRAEAEAALRFRCAPFGVPDEAHWQLLFEHGIEPDGGGFRLTCDPAMFAMGPPADQPMQDVNLWGLWPAVTAVPMLLIRGTESDILPRGVALQMQASHPRFTFREIAGTGHAPALMTPEQVEMVREWLSAPPNGGVR